MSPDDAGVGLKRDTPHPIHIFSESRDMAPDLGLWEIRVK